MMLSLLLIRSLPHVFCRKHNRGKTVQNGASKGDVLCTTSKNGPVSMTSFCESQEYTSIDEGPHKVHSTQTENLYDWVEVNSPEGTPGTIFYKVTRNGIDNGSCNAGSRPLPTEDNKSPLFVDDGLYLTPDVHEKHREQTDPDGRYSIIWPTKEN